MGLEVRYSPSRGLLLVQKKYALELLQHAGMLKCTTAPSPMISSENLLMLDGDLLDSAEATRYRSIVGGLQYLAITPSDLSFAVNKVCQYLHAPRSTH